MSRDPQPSLSQEAELERLIWEMIDALGTIDGVAMNDWGAGDPEFVKARSALLEYLADRTLTAEEAREIGHLIDYLTSNDSLPLARNALIRISGSPFKEAQ